MEIQDSVLKQYLKNVYFLAGMPCGGKTTISRELGRRHSLPVYDVDERFSTHQQMSSPAFQPAMNQAFANADAFFGRSVEEYAGWLLHNTREQLDYVLLDLIRLSQEQRVICDLHLTLDEAARLTEPERIVFLLRDPGGVIDDYCSRPDHSDFSRFINSASDPEAAKANCGRTLEYLNREQYERIKKSAYFWLERDEHSTVEEFVRKVEAHFRWQS